MRPLKLKLSAARAPADVDVGGRVLLRRGDRAEQRAVVELAVQVHVQRRTSQRRRRRSTKYQVLACSVVAPYRNMLPPELLVSLKPIVRGPRSTVVSSWIADLATRAWRRSPHHRPGTPPS